jgi:hypothetical protein
LAVLVEPLLANHTDSCAFLLAGSAFMLIYFLQFTLLSPLANLLCNYVSDHREKGYSISN